MKKKIIFIKIILAVAVFAVIFGFGTKLTFKEFVENGTEFVISGELPTRIFFVGDTMLDRHVRILMERYGYDYPFDRLEDFFGSVPVIANLEGVVSGVDVSGLPRNRMKFTFATSTAKLLKEKGVFAVSLGNNHALDYGSGGFESTKKYLSGQGIMSFGHPVSMSGNYSAKGVINGRPINLLSFNATYPSFDLETAGDAVQSASKSGDFTIVCVHWGEEYSIQSNDFQKKLAHEMIERGADLIIGTHPHVVQEAEIYKNKMIFYSLGNFIFDQYFSKETQEGFAVKLNLFNKKMAYELHPYRSILSQPYFLEGLEKDKWLSDFLLKSEIKNDLVFEWDNL